MFSEEDIQAFVLPQENCDVVEIPIDKFDFDRNSMQYGGQTSCLVEKPIIMFVQDEAIFKSHDGAKKFWKQNG